MLDSVRCPCLDEQKLIIRGLIGKRLGDLGPTLEWRYWKALEDQACIESKKRGDTTEAPVSDSLIVSCDVGVQQ